jgi:hypothetical protein
MLSDTAVKQDAGARKVLRPHKGCALILLPDWLDLAWWRTFCEEADPRAMLQVRNRTPSAGVSIRTLITYPELRLTVDGLANMTRIYVGYKGRIKWWHQAADVEVPSVESIMGMHPLWQRRMSVHSRYLWVGAVPFPVKEEWPVPNIPKTWPYEFYFGALVPDGEGDVMPEWDTL